MTRAVDSVFAAAADDDRRGAGEIERKLLEDLLRVRRSWTRTGLEAGVAALEQAHPAMANLRAVALRIRELPDGDLADWIGDRIAELDELPERLAADAWPEVRQADAVVTVSRSSAVSAVLVRAAVRGWSGRVLEEGPGRAWPVLEAVPLTLVGGRFDGRSRALC